MPLKGVKVAATSETQIGGAKVAYSNDEGAFRINGLQPGNFELRASAPKMRTLVQRDVQVGIAAATAVDLILEVEAAVETVKVIERAPVVSTTSATVQEKLDYEFLDSLPVSNRFAVESIVSANTAGSVEQGVRNVRMRGGGADQSKFMLEGFTATGQKVTTQSLAALEINTAGYGADNADTPGGVVNMVTKSGSNKFQFDVNGFHDDSNFRLFTDSGDTKERTWNSFVNPSFSGPIIKDRLWFFVNTEVRNQIRTPDPDPTGVLPPPVRWSHLSNRTSLKLTWQVTARNKLQSYSHASIQEHKNQGDQSQNERDALQSLEDRDWFVGLIWESLLGDNVFFKSQVGVGNIYRIVRPQRCVAEKDTCDHSSQTVQTFPRTVRQGNFNLHTLTLERTVEAINTLEIFASSRWIGEHAIKIRSRLLAASDETTESTPGDGWDQYNGPTPILRRTFYSNDPRIDPARFGWHIVPASSLTTHHSVSDAMRLGRYLTLTPGVALVTATSSQLSAMADLDSLAITPHVSAAWDATRDGRTAVRGSFNHYVDVDRLDLARFGAGSRVYQDCEWDAASQTFSANCRYGGGASRSTFGLPCGPSGVDARGDSCRERLKLPRTWESTLGAEREIAQGVGLGADFIYRLYTNPYEDRETNRIWNNGGTGLNPTGGYRNGVPEVVTDMGTPSTAQRRYLGVTASLRKREGALKVNASYTWSRLEGNVFNGESNEFGRNPVQDRAFLYGYLADDARHVVRSMLTYQVKPWLGLGLLHRYSSGRPYNRRLRNDVLNGFTDLRARSGTDAGANVNDPGDDRPLRLPDLQELSLQLRFNLKPATGQQIELFADIINVLAQRSTTEVIQQDGPAFGNATSRTEPARVRLGFRYRL